ncbi:MAG: 1-acyl-sn-glycerol-3-phosphate acyltransferase, partial [Syntrophorhabdaceae bacterium]|nr:1-acyl-sn-glycerol-3-phosphate acyltransferase [Syntrophorhabdaceae bacterium]
GRLWAKIHLFICGIKVYTDGLANITKPCIFMCNHQSVLDIFALYASLNVPFIWIAKKELFSVPFLGWALKTSRHIDMDRRNPKKALKSLNRAIQHLREGRNIVLFPEGTWNKGDKLLPFKKGGFNLAIKEGVPIIPVGIIGTHDLQPEGYNVPVKKGTIKVLISKPLYTSKNLTSQRDSLMESVKKELEKLVFIKGQ